MWVLTVRSYQDEPREYILKPGPTVIGRKLDGDNPLRDESASRRHMEIINQAEGEQIEIGLGVNSGACMVGYVGTEERAEFAVLGDIVNMAHRLELLARPNRMFLGPDTYQAVAGVFTIRPIGPVEVRGRTQPVEALEVVREHSTPPFNFIYPPVPREVCPT